MLVGTNLCRVWRRFRAVMPADRIWRRREHSAKFLPKLRRKTTSPKLASPQKGPADRRARNPDSLDTKEPEQNPLQMMHRYSRHRIGPAHWQARGDGPRFSDRPEGGAR